MESLEILDISRNKIREMPDDFGTLMSLKVKNVKFNHIYMYTLFQKH